MTVKPELLPSKDLLPIVLPSSPAIANTFVGRSASFCQANVEVLLLLKTFYLHVLLYSLV